MGLLGIHGFAQPAHVLESRSLHLRSGSQPEWTEFQNRTPAGRDLVIRFESEANSREAVLLITQDNVKLDWPVELNGKKLGALFLMEMPLVHTLAIPAGTLRRGENKLSILAPAENDDIVVGPISLEMLSLKESVGQAWLEIDANDAGSGGKVPCRVTIVDRNGHLAALTAERRPQIAIRPGVVYTGDGHARVGLQAGRYTLYGTRGTEYGLAKVELTVTAGEVLPVRIELRRELSTDGWVCSDTHVHTGSFARHGDATVAERAVTLAGEGIELPISTEHDCLVDLSDAASQAGVADRFTPVVGDEVTTTKGHFNIFPVSASARLPDRTITHWPDLMADFRQTPGVRVVVLNHPRNIHNNFQPFASTNFDASTGANLRGFEFTFDAIEVANSSAMQSDWMISLRDWFALLNYGYRFAAVGSSDGHDVSRYIIGQGRTYIACEDTDVGQIDVSQACRNLTLGRAIVSLGLFAQIQVEGRFGIGQLATPLPERIHVAVTVQAPSWLLADRVELFANGVPIKERRLNEPTSRLNESRRYEVIWDLPRPKQDAHLIALATGPGVQEPYWPLARPYQPSSPTWSPRVMAVTNPIWLDADGDGVFTAPRDAAQQLIRKYSGDVAGLKAAIVKSDPAVAVHVRSLLSDPTTANSNRHP